jgi:D-tyrosyl-tRNA(Tyr) deacylase
MIGLLQRVSRATVTVESELIAEIKSGMLVLVGVEKTDTEENAVRLVERLLGYRVFSDKQGRMNLSVQDVEGEVLLVPQFTLVADTNRGMRPSFSSAAPPEQGSDLFGRVVDIMSHGRQQVQAGRFGADMAVELVNDGPVTFWLQC